MISQFLLSPIGFVFSFLALITGITIHEFSHAWVADRLGDPTARLQGRVTLNPLAHLDPIGTLAILFLHFGWGRPVPFDPFNLRNPKRDSALISLAGPVSNLLLATAASLILRLIVFIFAGAGADFTQQLLQAIIVFNVILAVFNVLPIHPLDGFKIVGGMLPDDRAREWYALENYGLFFLLILLWPLPGGSVLQNILSPVVSLFLNILLP